MKLTSEFMQGYNAQDGQLDNPFIYSSPSWLAFKAGAEFAKYGTSAPIKCQSSRGYTLRIFTAANEWIATPDKTLLSWSFDRRG